MSRLNILEIFSTVALLKRKLNKLPVFKKGKIMIYYYKWEQLSQLTSSEYKDISGGRKSMKYVSFAYYHSRDRGFPCWPDLSLRHYFPIPVSSVERRFGREISEIVKLRSQWRDGLFPVSDREVFNQWKLVLRCSGLDSHC